MADVCPFCFSGHSSAAPAAGDERWDSVYGENAALYEEFSRYETE